MKRAAALDLEWSLIAEIAARLIAAPTIGAPRRSPTNTLRVVTCSHLAHAHFFCLQITITYDKA